MDTDKNVREVETNGYGRNSFLQQVPQYSA